MMQIVCVALCIKCWQNLQSIGVQYIIKPTLDIKHAVYDLMIESSNILYVAFVTAVSTFPSLTLTLEEIKFKFIYNLLVATELCN